MAMMEQIDERYLTLREVRSRYGLAPRRFTTTLRPGSSPHPSSSGRARVGGCRSWRPGSDPFPAETEAPGSPSEGNPMFLHRKDAVVRLDRAPGKKYRLLPRIAHFPASCKGLASVAHDRGRLL